MTGTVEVNVPFSNGTLTLHISRENLIEVLKPRGVSSTGRDIDKVRDAIRNPIGCRPLEEMVKSSDKVVIVADDITRVTPTNLILPVLLDELNRVGVDDSQMKVVIALGTHRPMDEKEIKWKFGSEVVGRVEVLNHVFRDPEQLVDLGVTSNGTPVHINREVFEADFKLGVGSIFPHHICGYSGGSKIVQPGVSGGETTGATHLLSVTTKRNYLGIAENIVRKEMDEISRKIGFNTVLNVVLDGENNVYRAFFGDIVKAHREGVKAVNEIYGVKTKGLKADIVVSNSYPADIDWWQAHKSLYPADKLVREGGIIIVLAPCPEHISKIHVDITDYAWMKPDEILGKVKRKEIEDVVAASLAIAWGKIRERAKVVLVSPGVTPDEASGLGFKHFEEADEALEYAFKKIGRKAKVTVLTRAPELLPIT